jgi:glycosyltransferase involved in cell wall biosynthesis
MRPHNESPPVYTIVHQPSTFTARSAFPPLIERLGATPLYYDVTWEKLQKKSWTLGHWLREAGIRYYGSTWNALVPWVDEWKLARRVAPGRSIVHFLWGEFASPRLPGLFKRRGATLIGTFHCSARRQPAVLGRFKNLRAYDWLTVVSATQIPFLEKLGYNPARIRFIPLGVDTDHFSPAPPRAYSGSGPLRAAMVGRTERDHEFLADVFRAIPADVMTLSVCTATDYHGIYKGIPSVTMLPFLSDAELVKLYQGTELVVMPMLDCTANDAMLEAMACGTPVMTNRVGGIAEYVDAACNYVMEGKDRDVWVKRLLDLARERQRLWASRAAVRAAAEKFDWKVVAPRYQELYDEALRIL